MKEQNLQTKIRRKNPYKDKIKDVLSDYYCENILMRDFRNRKPFEAFGIDITYLKLDFVLGTVQYAINNLAKLNTSIFIHSDRGSHFRANAYKELLVENKIIQSMSSAENPKDNAVIESFFGHMKDEIDLSNVNTFDDLVEIIHNYIYHYNYERK